MVDEHQGGQKGREIQKKKNPKSKKKNILRHAQTKAAWNSRRVPNRVIGLRNDTVLVSTELSKLKRSIKNI